MSNCFGTWLFYPTHLSFRLNFFAKAQKRSMVYFDQSHNFLWSLAMATNFMNTYLLYFLISVLEGKSMWIYVSLQIEKWDLKIYRTGNVTSFGQMWTKSRVFKILSSSVMPQGVFKDCTILLIFHMCWGVVEFRDVSDAILS